MAKPSKRKGGSPPAPASKLSEYLRDVPELTPEQLKQLDARRRVSAGDRRKLTRRIGTITKAIIRARHAHEAQHGPIAVEDPTQP